jgi:succinate dehydrogenase / fumarate reductase cytochrome b subunit
MPTPQRPLSPHLQIYKPQITTVLSILHRITGIILAFGAFAITVWLFFLSRTDILSGEARPSPFYEEFMALPYSILGKIFLVGLSYCLIYHLLNGIRHLFWDAGKGFEIKQTYASGWAVVVLSFVLTAGYWTFLLNNAGGNP